MTDRPYRPYRSSLRTVSRLSSRADAGREFERVVESIDSRLVELAGVVGPRGIVLDLTPASLEPLEAWFLQSVEADADRRDRLSALWYAISHDIGLYAGETLMRHAPVYKWVLSEDADSQYFHRCVVSGVADVSGKEWEWDPGQTVGDLGHQRIGGHILRSSFLAPMVKELVELSEHG